MKKGAILNLLVISLLLIPLFLHIVKADLTDLPDQATEKIENLPEQASSSWGNFTSNVKEKANPVSQFLLAEELKFNMRYLLLIIVFLALISLINNALKIIRQLYLAKFGRIGLLLSITLAISLTIVIFHTNAIAVILDKTLSLSTPGLGNVLLTAGIVIINALIMIFSDYYSRKIRRIIRRNKEKEEIIEEIKGGDEDVEYGKVWLKGFGKGLKKQENP